MAKRQLDYRKLAMLTHAIAGDWHCVRASARFHGAQPGFNFWNLWAEVGRQDVFFEIVNDAVIARVIPVIRCDKYI